jgi:hypothetical protein
MFVAVASPMVSAPWISSVFEKFFTAVLELVSDLEDTRLATVLVAKSFDELTSWFAVSLRLFIELLLLELFESSAKFDAVFAVRASEAVEDLEVPNVSEAFCEPAKVAFKDLVLAKLLLALNAPAAFNEVVLLPEALLVKSPATAGPFVAGPLLVEPVLLDVLPPLDAALAELEEAVSEAEPFLADAAKAPVELLLPCLLPVVARLAFAANAAASVVVELAVRPAFTVDPSAAALVVAEFFDAEAVFDSDALFDAVTDWAADFMEVLLFEVLKTFDVSLVFDFESVVEAFREVFRLFENELFLVTFDEALTVNWLFAPR